MTPRIIVIALIAAATLPVAAPTLAAPGVATDGQRLAYDVTEGRNVNAFLRDGPVAAHLVLRSGTDPRILVAFPAGNSGVGLWFAHSDRQVRWQLDGPLEPRRDSDEKGRPLYGIVAEVSASGADLGAHQALLSRSLLSSVRVLRDYQTLGTLPSGLTAPEHREGRTISWARPRLDGAAGYRLDIEVVDGELRGDGISAGSDGRIRLRISALCGETPLTPLAGAELLDAGAAADPDARNALTFLSYREKFLAGSWRFNTYFGRDTLMSVRLLMPALTPLAVESGIGAVLTRVSPTGQVAHEEDIGEWAVLAHRQAGEPPGDAPLFNYLMIDGNYLLAPVVRAWLFDDPRGRERGAAFLARQDGRAGDGARPFGADLVANLRLVLRTAEPFAGDPRASNLIALLDGRDSGQWRDSGEGLGRGRIPYDVNAILVPAALLAAADLYHSGLLDRYLAAADRDLFGRAAAMAAVWRAKAPGLFDVTVLNGTARQAIARYGRSEGVPADTALRSIGAAPVRFHALSLLADGSAVPVIHSDEGFGLLFGNPDPSALDLAVQATMRPFPAGLMTDVGLLVANPVYASADVQARFSRNAYHGTVVWSWQQALLAAGLERQLRREDLPASVRADLRTAQRQLWRAIDAARTMRNSELWSWSYAKGRYEIAPFGASEADADESNAAQLWSTVYLAIPEPAP